MDFGISQKIAQYIMRPPRTKYCLDDLGPNIFKFKEKVYERIDFRVQNNKNQKIECSYYKQKYSEQKRQTIIFLHANSSSRLAVKNYLSDLISFFNIVCFDCTGSGISEGNYVTLGYNQKEDLKCVINRLKIKYQLERFILWGRSMGAVTSLLYAAKYQQFIQALVVDNAFSDLEQVCIQLKDNFFSLLPDFFIDYLVNSAQEHIGQTINRKENIDFQIKLLKPKKIIKDIKCPIVFVYSQDDTIVRNSHTKTLYELSNQSKKLLSVPGNHNSPRQAEIKEKIVKYLLQFTSIQKNIKQGISKKYSLHDKNNLKFDNQVFALNLPNCESNQEETQIGIVFDNPFNQQLRKTFKNFNQKDKNMLQQQNNKLKIHQIKSFQLIQEKCEQKSDNTQVRNRLSYSVNQISEQRFSYQDQESNFMKQKRRRRKIFQK